MKGCNNMWKKIGATLLAGALLLPMTMGVAEEVQEQPETGAEVVATKGDTMDFEFDGSVVSGVSKSVTSAVGGVVESVNVRAGQLVNAGDVLATLKTEKVYASQAGTVAAVFGEAGDSISEIASRYGAVVYIEPESGAYTLSADTDKAYDSSDNLYIHVGETVYLKCTDGDHTGTGFVSSVTGSDYTVEVTSGTFEVGENVNIFRGESYAAKTRIGRGSCERGADVTVGGTSSGMADSSSIVAMHVAAGDVVQKGDLLYETLSGEYVAYYCTGADIVADATGILGELNLSVGGNVSANGAVATVYPTGDMQIETSINEADLGYINEGDSVVVRLNWDEGETEYAGSVFSISHMAQSSGGTGEMTASTSTEAEYVAIIDFTPDENVRLGMTATVELTVQQD